MTMSLMARRSVEVSRGAPAEPGCPERRGVWGALSRPPMSLMAIVLTGAALAALPLEPARAEHFGGPLPGRLWVDVGVGFRITPEGVALDGRLTAPEGVWGGSVDSRVGRDGLTLDGRFWDAQGAFAFRLDAHAERVPR